MANIDLYIVVSILLDYHNELIQWCLARTLSKRAKLMVDKRPYDKGCFGRSSFFRNDFCMVCERQSPGCNWLRYCADVLREKPRLITHCNAWPCHISALLSMIEDYTSENIYLLRAPLDIPAEPIDIPRTSGHITKGFYHKNAVVKRDNVWYISVYWRDSDIEYYKLVPLTQYTLELPRIMFQTT